MRCRRVRVLCNKRCPRITSSHTVNVFHRGYSKCEKRQKGTDTAAHCQPEGGAEVGCSDVERDVSGDGDSLILRPIRDDTDQE